MVIAAPIKKNTKISVIDSINLIPGTHPVVPEATGNKRKPYSLWLTMRSIERPICP